MYRNIYILIATVKTRVQIVNDKSINPFLLASALKRFNWYFAEVQDLIVP